MNETKLSWLVIVFLMVCSAVFGASPSFWDNFDDLSGWTDTGLTVATNEVKATVGGTIGYAYKSHGVFGAMRMACDFIPDKTDTATRYMALGISDNSNGSGVCVTYIAGTGIVISNVFGGGLSAPPLTILADADITSGERYHCESFYAMRGNIEYDLVVTIYDKNGNFLAGGEKSGFNENDRILIFGNSDTSTISRVAFEPSYMPSSVTDKYLHASYGYRLRGNTGDFDLDVNVEDYECGVAVPARLNDLNLVAIFLHGVGNYTYTNFVGGIGTKDWNRRSEEKSIAVTLCEMGIPVIYPKQWSDDANSSNSWASPQVIDDLCNGGWTGQLEGNDWIDWIITEFATAKGIEKSEVKVIIYGGSMGGLTASRIITCGLFPQNQIHAGGLFIPVIDLFQAWKNVAWTAQLEASWEISPADDAAAHVLLDPHDPIDLTTADVAIWDDMQVFMAHTLKDTDVDSTLHADPLKALLDAGGTADVVEIRRTDIGSHLEKFAVDGHNFTAEVLSFSVDGGSSGGVGYRPRYSGGGR